MWNARLDEAQAGIKVAGRNINNLRYTDDTTLMAENEEELKSLSIKMKEKSETVGLKHKLESRLPGKEKKVKSLSHVQIFTTLWTVTYQASLSMGFSRQEY